MEIQFIIAEIRNICADLSGRTVRGVGLRPLACWDCGFESRRSNGYLSLVSVVWCHVGVSEMDRSLVQRSSTKCGVSSECYLEISTMRRRGPTKLSSCKKVMYKILFIIILNFKVWNSKYWGRQSRNYWDNYVNPLAPKDVYIRRTAQLTSRRCILNVYSTNILTEYFKHAANSPSFSLQDTVYFIMLPFLVPVIFTF